MIEKTQFFAVFKNNKFTNKIMTDYQIDIMFGENSQNKYIDKDITYEKLYYEKYDGEEEELYFYLNPHENFYRDDNDLLVAPLVKRENEQVKWRDFKDKKSKLIDEVDKKTVFLPPDEWQNKSEQYKIAWNEYKNFLQSLPGEAKSPDEVVWPSAPIVEN